MGRDNRGFLVEDPALRAAIMPLFAIDTRDLAERPRGRGTTFRINPWGACATAFHVIEELLEPRGEQAVLRGHVRLVALELEGVGYGAVPIRREQWRTFEGMLALAGIEGGIGRPRQLRNVTELAALSISRSPGALGNASFLEVDLSRWRPAVGEQVTALGFADLDLGDDAIADRPISQYLYGSHARITDVEPADASRGRPWPFFRVDKDWAGGMSGGPVLNADGHVVGIVSTGISLVATGSAVSLAGNSIAQRMFPHLNPGAPGHINCWGGIGADDSLLGIAPSREALLEMPSAPAFVDILHMSCNPRTGDYMRV